MKLKRSLAVCALLLCLMAGLNTALGQTKTHHIVFALTSGDEADWNLTLGNMRNLLKSLRRYPLRGRTRSLRAWTLLGRHQNLRRRFSMCLWTHEKKTFFSYQRLTRSGGVGQGRAILRAAQRAKRLDGCGSEGYSGLHVWSLYSITIQIIATGKRESEPVNCCDRLCLNPYQ